MLQAMSRSRKQKEKRTVIDKQAAFIEFKALENESGPQHEATIKQCRHALKETRNHIRVKTEQCNVIKAKIDQIKDKLDFMTQEKKDLNMRQGMSPGTTKQGFLEPDEDPAEDIIDEEELFHLKQMKELKRQYRETFNELKDFKNEANFNQKAIDNAKTQLVNDFEIWYADTFGDFKDESRNASPLNSQQQKKRSGSPAKIIRDAAMDEDAFEGD